MKPTNSFKTNEDYYKKLFGRRKTTKKNPNKRTVIDKASENLLSLPYSLIPSDDYAPTYGLALDELRNSKSHLNPKHIITIKGKEYVRPLTFKETLEAKLNLYKSEMTNEEKSYLIDSWLSTCTAIARKRFHNQNNNNIKIIPVCEELITLDSAFDDAYLVTSYDFLRGIEIDTRYGLYGQFLSKDEVKVHPGWLAAVERDNALLSEYVDLVFSLSKKNNMGFFLMDISYDCQLRTLSIQDDSSANAINTMNNNTRFMRLGNKKQTKYTKQTK